MLLYISALCETGLFTGMRPTLTQIRTSFPKSNNDFDLHVKQLFHWQEQYTKDLETIRDRLIAWQKNNISAIVGEDFKQYQDGSSGNVYWAFEWHDTISGLKWYQDTPSAGYFEDNAADHRR